MDKIPNCNCSYLLPNLVRANRFFCKNKDSPYYGMYFWCCARRDGEKCGFWILDSDIPRNETKVVQKKKVIPQANPTKSFQGDDEIEEEDLIIPDFHKKKPNKK